MTRACAALSLFLAWGGCATDPPSVPTPTVRMDFADAEDFYSSPFPSETRRNDDGRIELSGFPNTTRADIVDTLVSMLEADARGFATTSPVFFTTTTTLPEGELVSYADSLASEAPIFLVDVDEASMDVGRRFPIEVRFRQDGGPFGAPNFLSLLPLQGAPLRPDTVYAAVVTTGVVDAAGQPLEQSATVAELAAGDSPEGMPANAVDAYRDALGVLSADSVTPQNIAGLTVFRTGDPTAVFEATRSHLLSQPRPALTEPLELLEQYDDYCVYRGALQMPTYQSGEPPYELIGGGFVVDASGQPMLQATERARVLVTIPKAPMPAEGFSTVVFSRTGGGGDRPLVDRGARAEAGGSAEAGTGPAREMARVGWAGVSVDGPHGGYRNVSGADEQFLVFNVNNPLALRDNIRQSALELSLTAQLLSDLSLDVSGCTGTTAPGDVAAFDDEKLVVMGHSMGATIAPLALAFEPRFRGAILSGAGGSFIANIVHKLSPIEVRPFAEILLNVTGRYRLHEHDPVLALLQWAGEPADPPVYGRRIMREAAAGEAPRHVLMLQGIVDTYILPPIANATSLSIGLDLAGTPLDADHPELAEHASLQERLALSEGTRIELPVQGNYEAPDGLRYTAVVVQHAEGPIEDGHEVAFQTEGPKEQYRCFLSTLATGVPRVPAVGGACE